MPSPLLVSFVGGDEGTWQVERLAAVAGETLPAVARLEVVEGTNDHRGAWVLRGVTSNERYVERVERVALVAKQQGLGRPDASLAALIPIRKSAEWWELTQEERRATLETRSEHIAIGLDYLPAIARRLHHGRDLGEDFDFLTWFEFAPSDAGAFEELVGRLRQTEEWSYVDREVDLRLTRTPDAGDPAARAPLDRPASLTRMSLDPRRTD